jgi:hypothetical protein
MVQIKTFGVEEVSTHSDTIHKALSLLSPKELRAGMGWSILTFP